MVGVSNSNEYGSLLENIRRVVTFSKEDEAMLTPLITTARVKKRQFIDQPGFISQYRNYIVKGCFRSFFTDRNGKDHTIQIAVEDWFVSDFHSYISRTPATLFVEALEESLILRMKYEDIEGLCRNNHRLSEYFRITTERAFASSRKRALSRLSMTAEERYADFLNHYPNIAGRVPQKVLASYLGMSPEFLSKIRGQLAQDS